MPENTTPMTVSRLTRLFCASQPVAMAQNMPAPNAPSRSGSPAT